MSRGGGARLQPSLDLSWILFNETWGLDEHQTPRLGWRAGMFDLARSLDATRLIEDNSACLYDHISTRPEHLALLHQRLRPRPGATSSRW